MIFLLTLSLAAQETRSPNEIPELIKKLGSDAASERDEAELRLKRVGDPAIPYLNGAVADANPEVAERAKRALQAIISPDFSNRLLVKVPRVEWGLFGVAYSPDSRTLAGSTGDASSILWNATTGQKLLILGGSLPDIPAHCIAFAPNGKTVVARGRPGNRMSVWDLETGKELLQLAVGATVGSVAYSPDGGMIATGEDGSVRLWKAATGLELPALERCLGQVRSLAFTSDGQYLAAASHTSSPSVRVWNVSARKVVQALKDSNDSYAVTISPSEGVLATGNAQGTIALWNLETGSEVGRIDAGKDAPERYAVVSLSYSPRGNLLAAGCSDGYARIWRTASRKQIARFGSGKGWIRSVTFSPDGSQFATSHGEIWNVADIAGK